MIESFVVGKHHDNEGKSLIFLMRLLVHFRSHMDIGDQFVLNGLQIANEILYLIITNA